MLAVSATYPEFLANALTKYMRDPTFVRLNASDPSLIGILDLSFAQLVSPATYVLLGYAVCFLFVLTEASSL